MSPTVVQLNFKLNVSADDYTQIATSLGETFANVDGLDWKIWLLNRDTAEAGGIYLFRDPGAADAFLTGPVAAQVKAAPFLTDLSVKRFAVMEAVTAVTRGPVVGSVVA